MTVDILLICHDVDRGDIKQGLPYSKLIDSLHEEFARIGFRCKQVALPGSSLVGEKAWGHPDSFEDFFKSNGIQYRFKQKFLSKLYKFLKVKQDSENNKVKKWKLIFYKLKPKAIFVIGATPAMCLAAKIMKIPLLEVLHGIGYIRIAWGWEVKQPLELPDFILCLDKRSWKSFSPLESKGLKVKEIPHPWYKRFIGRVPQDLDPQWVQPLGFMPSDKKIILISLTWGYDGDHGDHTYFSNIIPNGLMPDELVSVIEDTKHDVFYCIRRHPVQIRLPQYKHQIEFLEKFVEVHSNCEFIQSSEATLISLLQKTVGHITMSSMTSYDAAIMGVQSLLLCPTLLDGRINQDAFEDLVEAGYAKKIGAKKSLIKEWVYRVQRMEPFHLTDAKENDWESFIYDLIRN